MVQHLSIRVPWHDHGWDGTVCQDPCGNTACLKLNGILEGKKEDIEVGICGKCLSGHEDDVPCLSEGAAFMSPTQFVSVVKHPYVDYGYEEYQHFLPTENVYPPFSLCARPFGWLLKSSMHDLNVKYNLEIDEDAEREWPRGKNWLQFGESQEVVFNYFYKDVVVDKSLCLVYAKQVPFVEDAGRVIIGIGHVKNISKVKEHKHTNAGSLRSMLWETHISHSIREDHQDGFLIPYEKVMEYAADHPEFDVKSIFVFAPDDAFAEFSYATEHVSYDAVIEVLLSCIKSFRIINEILGEDYSNVLQWLDERLNEVWDERGAFPGLGSMLCAIKVPHGILVAKEVYDKLGEEDDIWDTLDAVFENPAKYLSKTLADGIDEFTSKVWAKMPEERKTLFKLLSRFDLSITQAETLYQENLRLKEDIKFSDADIIKNPYILYECTRLKRDELAISVKRIDRAVFPVESVREQYPLEAPTALKADNDVRRVRALAVYALEQAADLGNTILPVNHLIDKMQEIPLQPECGVTADHIAVIEDEITDVIIAKTQTDGSKYYKLTRYEEFDHEIERKIRKKLKGDRIDIQADWRQLLDDYLFNMGQPRDTSGDAREERARTEKTAALKELAESKISVLVGDAGTGKTTVLAVLCSHQDIIDGGVLLLAPTGKATVRLMESIGEAAKQFDARNIAQYLYGEDRFDHKDMRYKLSDATVTKKYETVIVDESSMITEEMFGSLMQAVGGAKRIIFVGDPNQLPPIGAGRPFVDLIKILRHHFGSKFPKVRNGYCELVENCRQATGGQRLDVEFAKLFTDTDFDLDRNIVTEIVKSEGKNIKFLRWNTNTELEEKLFEVLADEYGITDQVSFDKSFGGVRDKYGNPWSYFNAGCAETVDAWQILAPVKNMPQGVLNINHLIHSKYRAEELLLSRADKKHIASPWGYESVVYGDKVINIRNMEGTAYPKNDGARNYIANGEIGICCGDYKFKPCRKFDDNSLRVEFSSQKGYGYYYNFANFNEETGTNDLELAYALTVHKSQGSQFDTVILILAEPCRILSREMLYSALTRQKKKIVVLYNDDPHLLMKYVSPENSDIAQRFTDLFAGMLRTDDSENKPSIIKVGNKFYEDSLIHRTTRGELVRSKSEVVIADHLLSNKINYDYEPEVTVGDKKFRPDFVAYDPDDDDIFWYWEHVGMPTDPCYMARWENKKAYYAEHGIIEGKNLIITCDGDDGSLDAQVIDKLIKKTFDLD